VRRSDSRHEHESQSVSDGSPANVKILAFRRIMIRTNALLLLLFQPAWIWAQSDGAYRRHWAYGFMSPGFTNDPEKTALWELGAGYEWLAAKSLGIRGDGAVMVAGVEGVDFAFPITLNASWHFRRALLAERQWTPFITGGYTRGGFSQSSNMFNIGGGINSWTAGCCGFRFEILHHMSGCAASGPGCRRDWYLDARLGFVIKP
jgi:hypothetical protein